MLRQNQKGKGQIKKSISKLIKINEKLLIRFDLQYQENKADLNREKVI